MTLGKLPKLSEPLANGNSTRLKRLLKVLNEKHSVLILGCERGIGVTMVTDSSRSTLPASTAHQLPPHSFIPRTRFEHKLYITVTPTLASCALGINGEQARGHVYSQVLRISPFTAHSISISGPIPISSPPAAFNPISTLGP